MIDSATICSATLRSLVHIRGPAYSDDHRVRYAIEEIEAHRVGVNEKQAYRLIRIRFHSVERMHEEIGLK